MHKGAAALIAGVAILASGKALAQNSYKVDAETGGTPVFRSITAGYDALELIKAGSTRAAMRLVRCNVDNGAELKLISPHDRLFMEMLVLTGPEAGCKGQILRMHVLRTNQETGITERVK